MDGPTINIKAEPFGLYVGQSVSVQTNMYWHSTPQSGPFLPLHPRTQ